jgi:hypothetical protein
MPINPVPFWTRPRRPRPGRPLLALGVGLGILASAVIFVLRAWPA